MNPWVDACVRKSEKWPEEISRLREYNQYFSEVKQVTTRVKRVEKYARKILGGRGFRDH